MRIVTFWSDSRPHAVLLDHFVLVQVPASLSEGDAIVSLGKAMVAMGDGLVELPPAPEKYQGMARPRRDGP